MQTIKKLNKSKAFLQNRWYVFILFVAFTNSGTAQSFVHPGLLHSKEDLQRMRNAVMNKQEPIYSGYQVFIKNPASQKEYKMQGPLAMVGRNPTVGQGTYDNDANAAHQNAIMWAITNDTAYANKAKEIVNAWSSTLKSVTGRDAILMAGLGPFKMVNAAEILRYTNSGWSDADISQTEKHFKEVIYPVLKNFAPFANGNWDAAAIKTMLAIAVFCNDRPMFERALNYYVNGKGNGRLTNYVINEEGQIQESGRDQAHTQLGIGLLSECCEIAWHQGLNLYGYADNRLLKGFEYVARFNLGYEVPFTEWLDRTGKYHHTKISQQSRGDLRAVFEQVYNHYVNRIELLVPYTQKAAEKLRPEGPGRPGADHPGYGTLYYSRLKENNRIIVVPAQPAGLVTGYSNKQVKLTWIEPIGAKSYTVKRSVRSGGPYTTIAKGVKSASFIDKRTKPGTVYYYTISSVNQAGESANSVEVSVSAGLPSTWNNQDIGPVGINGYTLFNGREFKMEGSGTNIDSTTDQFHFAYLPEKGDATITARFVPQTSSQFSKFGLMMREELTGDAAHISLLITPESSGSIEAPGWNAKMIFRKKAGENTSIIGRSRNFTAPVVSNGRLMGYYWLRLIRKGDQFTALTSEDGSNWSEISTALVSLKKKLYVGLPVCSRLGNVSTLIVFDHVSVNN
jgi:hypothetical protein